MAVDSTVKVRSSTLDLCGPMQRTRTKRSRAHHRTSPDSGTHSQPRPQIGRVVNLAVAFAASQVGGFAADSTVKVAGSRLLTLHPRPRLLAAPRCHSFKHTQCSFTSLRTIVCRKVAGFAVDSTAKVAGLAVGGTTKVAAHSTRMRASRCE